MKTNNLFRREFLKLGGTAMALSLQGYPLNHLNLFTSESVSSIPKEWTVQDVIDKIMSRIPGEKRPDSVDTLKSGDPSQKVTGIATTFLATVEVIEKAAAANCNMIITHEPTFYNHRDEVEWLEDDPVYLHKKELIAKHKIAIWRFHDYWHQHRPDGILSGFLRKMNWEENLDQDEANVCNIPTQTLKTLAEKIKNRFGSTRCSFIGDPNLQCRRAGVLPGSWGREPHIELLRKDIDVLIIGEAAEWETVEYVRDAASAGFKKGLIIIGHALSEEPGMDYLADWLAPILPEMKVVHIPAHDPFITLD